MGTCRRCGRLCKTVKNIEEPSKGYSASLSLAVALIVFASLAIWFCKDISRAGIQQRGGVGPRAFPIGLSVCLLAGGIAEATSWFWMVAKRRLRTGRFSLASLDDGRPAFTHGRSSEVIQVVLLVIALASYIFAISWLGFTLSSWLFAFVMLVALRANWFSSLIVASVLVMGIKLLFYYLFKVQLPDGVLNLPL